MSSSVRKCDLPETLFSVDDDVEEEPVPGPDSVEFAELVDEVSAKQERRKKAKTKTIAASRFDRALYEVDEMIRTGDWEEASARHLVALYDRMHVKCYGVEADLDAEQRYVAVMIAANFVKREMNDDFIKAIEFMRWAWTREMRNEKWRRENDRVDAKRIGIHYMFSKSLLIDYKVYLARTSSRS